jgi:hypothetical protein
VRFIESRHRRHFRQEPMFVPRRDWVPTEHALQVWVRDDLTALAGTAVATETDITALIWHGVPSDLNAAPFEVITGISTDGSGHTEFQIDSTGLAIFDPITFMYVKPNGDPINTRFGARTIIPDYD